MSKENNKEIRTYGSDFQIRQADDRFFVVGYAALYNSVSSNLGGFVEVIADGAFTDELIRSSDVFCLLNHREDRGLLARYKEGECDSLKLTADEKGLKYEFELPVSPLGQELKSYLERKEITHSSFAFTVESDVWEDYKDDLKKRTILKFGGLFDVSPVYIAAYPDTTCAKRSLDDFIKNAAIEQRKLQEERDRKLEVYYRNLREKYGLAVNG
jgi:HK97 family phage prohead protease